MNTQPPKDFVTFDEAASYLAISRSQIYALVKRRIITPFKPKGKRVYFRLSNLNDFIEGGQVSTLDKIKKGKATDGGASPSNSSNVENRSPPRN
jgi:excisionase family DNA binding protein